MSRSASALLPVLVCLASGLASAEAQLTVSEARGKAAYYGEAGSGLDGAVARIEGTAFDLPATSFACASCHGPRGHGRSERGVQPTNLTRGSLTRPYEVTLQAGRVRPGYNRELFARAVREGVDSGGNELNQAMPRFNLDKATLGDIWAFLAKIDQIDDPGVTASEISIGVYLGHDGSAGHAADIRKLLDQFANDINALGGIHDRKLTWVWLETGDTAHSVFSILLAPSRHALVTSTDVPVIGWSGDAPTDHAGFRLVAGPEEQMAALRMYSVQELGVVALQDACMDTGDGVVLLSDIRCLAQAPNARTILMPHGVFAGMSDADRDGVSASIYVSLPVDFESVAPQARANFFRLRARAGTSGAYVLEEAEAYTAAAVLTETLTRAGRQLDRRGFVETLEDIQGFRGGIAHPISYTVNDHTGTNGALIVRYDKAARTLESSGVWIDPTGGR